MQSFPEINLLSQYAVDIEVENTDDVEGLIEAIIKANQNLTESNNNNDWEMVGKDIQKLQELITSLEEMKKIEDQEKEELEQQQANNSDPIVEGTDSEKSINMNENKTVDIIE